MTDNNEPSKKRKADDSVRKNKAGNTHAVRNKKGNSAEQATVAEKLSALENIIDDEIIHQLTSIDSKNCCAHWACRREIALKDKQERKTFIKDLYCAALGDESDGYTYGLRFLVPAFSSKGLCRSSFRTLYGITKHEDEVVMRFIREQGGVADAKKSDVNHKRWTESSVVIENLSYSKDLKM